jgi:hypothetical protein
MVVDSCQKAKKLQATSQVHVRPRALHIVGFFRKTTHLRAHCKALSKWESQWERNSVRVAPDLTSPKVLSAC